MTARAGTISDTTVLVLVCSNVDSLDATADEMNVSES